MEYVKNGKVKQGYAAMAYYKGTGLTNSVIYLSKDHESIENVTFAIEKYFFDKAENAVLCESILP